MEGGTTTIELTMLIALGGLMVAAVALLSGVWFRLGQLGNHVGQLDRRFDRQAEENRETREEFRQEIRETREEFRQGFREMREEFRQEIRETREELRQEMQEMREEFRQGFRETREELRQEMQEMRDENRRNHQQLLQALAHHSHDPDTGFAIFRLPPGMENPAA